jgi:ribosomal-protein-alanine N-acetyltransferase
MNAADLAEVLAMERDLFSDPWPEEMFLQDIGEGSVGCAVVGEREDGIICYGVAWQVRREYHIANMAVRRGHHRRGIGAWLLDGMLEEARMRDCEIATLEVRFSNRAAIELYKSRGFREVAIRAGYYTDNGEDALVMLRELGEHSGDQGGVV